MKNTKIKKAESSYPKCRMNNFARCLKAAHGMLPCLEDVGIRCPFFGSRNNKPTDLEITETLFLRNGYVTYPWNWKVLHDILIPDEEAEHAGMLGVANLGKPDSPVFIFASDIKFKLMAGWIVTAPKDLPESETDVFFATVYDFLNERYGAPNCIQAVVHKDEGGAAHMHYCFIPVVKDKKHGGEKICCNDVLNRTELRNFHPALQKYLIDHGIEAKIMTGVTKSQGGNRTVKELKQIDRPIERRHGFTRSRGWSNRQYDVDHTIDIGR